VEGRTRATYELREPGKYFTAVVGRLEDVGRQEAGGQVLRGFAGMRTEDETRKNLAAAESLIAFFSGLYGPNPFPVINHVVSEAMAPGGHSPPGLVYLQHRPAVLITQPLREDPADFRKRANFFLAHELAHQWWGQGVAPATYRGQWLSEAWAQYSAALWVRHREGEEAFRGMMDRMAGWALRHDEKGPIHLGQRLGHVEGDARIRRSIVYNKGAWVLHMLRQLLGDEAFFGGARDFLAAHRYGKATTEDLRDALEHAGARDLEPYFERWVYETGLPRVRWATHTDETFDGFRTTVQVAPEGLPGPVPLTIEVRTAGEPASRRVVLDPAGGSWTIESLEPVRDVRVNEDRGLLGEVERVRRLREEP
jgi:aminopeptidase N